MTAIALASPFELLTLPSFAPAPVCDLAERRVVSAGAGAVAAEPSFHIDLGARGHLYLALAAAVLMLGTLLLILQAAPGV